MEYTEQLLAAAAVLTLLAALLWYARKRGWVSGTGGARPGRRMEAIERLALAPHHTLYLVRVGDETLVVACSPAGCALLDRVPARQIAAAGGERS
jgi:flagellar biogenesis protein FliO